MKWLPSRRRRSLTIVPARDDTVNWVAIITIDGPTHPGVYRELWAGVYPSRWRAVWAGGVRFLIMRDVDLPRKRASTPSAGPPDPPKQDAPPPPEYDPPSTETR